ncbi:hypothetical protein FF2_006165 [Malus domestica]
MPEDLQNTLFQMLQRLKEASLGSRNKTGLAPPKGEKHRTTQPDEVVIVNPVLPFSEAPVNMLNMTWAEKGKGKIIREEEEGKLAKRPTEGIGKPSEYPKAAIIKGLVMCSKCQCECELEIPPAGVLIDHELIKREAREKLKQATRKNTSRSVFQRLGGDSQPKALSEVFRNYEVSDEFRNYEVSDEAEYMKAKLQRSTEQLQNGQKGKEVRRTDGIANPVKKATPAYRGRKWYVVGKDGQPTRPMGASMVRRVQRQHKAYMNSLMTPITSEASKNQKPERATSGSSSQLRWRSKKEVERANGKTEGMGNHVPQSQHPGKYRILRRAQEDLTMMPTPGWRPGPTHEETVASERRPTFLPLDPFGEVPKQALYGDMNQPQQEGIPEPLLPADAMAWLDEFMDHIGSKKEDLLEPSNFHINMTYVLSAMFGARPDQPATMEGDYLTTEPMMAHVNVEVVTEEDSGEVESSKVPKGGPLRIYTDKMVFSRPSISLANHLKPIYVSAYLEGVPFKRILIDGGAAVNILPAKQMKRMGRSTEDLIPTNLTVSSFSGAITRTHGILPLEVDLGSKKIMLAFFVVDCTSTYGALLGRDWIHQSLAIPSTLHQQVAVYHEASIEGSSFWELVEAESRPFLPSANVAEANFYNPNVGILKCLGADENGRPTKVTARKLLEQGMLLTKEELLVYGKGRRQEEKLLDKEEQEWQGKVSTSQQENEGESCTEELDKAIQMAECVYDIDEPDGLPENPELVEFLCAEPDKPPPEVQDPLEVIDLGT